ncbi:MAG: Mpo1-like protein, partial [Woeseiaceae bacterium]
MFQKLPGDAVMRTMQQWLDEYSHSHRPPTNKTIHWICVPAFLFSVLGLLWLIPVPRFAATIGPW